MSTPRAVLFALAVVGVPGSAMDWETLERRVQGAKDLDAVIADLPDSYRCEMTLVRKTNSLQPADPPRFRPILYGDGTFLMAFHGAEKANGYDQLETIEFDKTRNRWVFRAVSVPPSGAVVENPPKCLRCHGSPPRPIWSNFPFWSEPVGANDDVLDDTDKKELAAFLADTTLPRRYQALKGCVEKRFQPGSKRGKYFPGARMDAQPNETLNDRLARWNSRRVAQGLIDSPSYAKYKYVIAASLQNCGESILKRCIAQTLAPGAAMPIGELSRELDAHTERTAGAPDAAETLVLLDRKLRMGLNVDLKNWSLVQFDSQLRESPLEGDLGPNRFNNGIGGAGAGFGTFFEEGLAPLDDHFKQMTTRIGEDVYGRKFCVVLEARCAPGKPIDAPLEPPPTPAVHR